MKGVIGVGNIFMKNISNCSLTDLGAEIDTINLVGAKLLQRFCQNVIPIQTLVG